MTPEEHLRSGDLEAALAALQDRMRADAADAKLRIFLFQLLCVLGDWKRAINQLKVCGEMSTRWRCRWRRPTARRSSARCTAKRSSPAKRNPLVFGEPQDWVAPADRGAQAARPRAAPADAANLRAKAFDEAPGQRRHAERRSPSNGSPMPTCGSAR